MRKLVILLILSFKFTFSSGQERFYNSFFSLGSINPTPTNFIFKNDNIVVSFLFYDSLGNRKSKTGLLIINPQDTIVKVIHEIRGQHRPLISHNNFYYIIGNDDEDSVEEIRVAKLDSTFNNIWVKAYNTIGISNANVSSFYDENHLYVNSIIDLEATPLEQVTNILKLDFEGNQVWSEYYADGCRITFGWEVERVSNDLIIFSSTKVSQENNSALGTVFGLDNNGSYLWDYTSTEEASEDYIPFYTCVLTNKKIVVLGDTRDFLSGYYPFPPLLTWIDQTGSFMFSKKLFTPYLVESYLNQIEIGKGDYFFGYGVQNDLENDQSYGWLIKFDNDGNTLWEHRYQHPDFLGNNDYYSLNDLIELENGNLLLLGSIFTPNEPTKIWLLSLNKEGCLSDYPCNMDIITKLTEIINNNPSQIKLYPNPSNEIIWFYFDSVINLEKAIIVDSHGYILEHLETDLLNYSLDISSFSSGIYSAIFYLKNGQFEVIRFIKN